MAHGPSPFGIPQREQGRPSHSGADINSDDRSPATAAAAPHEPAARATARGLSDLGSDPIPVEWTRAGESPKGRSNEQFPLDTPLAADPAATVRNENAAGHGYFAPTDTERDGARRPGRTRAASQVDPGSSTTRGRTGAPVAKSGADLANAPTARLSAEEMSLPSSGTQRSPEEEMEQHLERIHASRPLRRAARRARKRTRWWLIALSVVSGLAVVAACGAGAFIVLREGEPDPVQSSQPQADPAQASEEDEAADAPQVVDPIENRDTDPEPITAAELFGAGTIAPEGAAGAYEVLDTEELSNCADAALDELAELLADTDCTQTVRSTLVSLDGAYVATAGVLNLADAAEAEELRTAIDEGLEGGFAAFRTGGAGEELGRSATMVGYNTYGHYLMYAVIGRTDGEHLESENEAVRTIVNDVVDVWLVDQLNPRREVE
ncbi:hypothetical protein [Glycomyces buryatensis]|uniref:Uncharacterized protein n=1 Tax=Glycomyces buryatensis TaxID=2570927 RepID=A0A4S8QGK9_9ACTN|nr:hypothetical protein [Glycomyces buryatensis]THV42851.1 hypothetical protein FAB82_03605 [Glycomyces buryatensis]